MLAVRIHGEHVGEAGRECRLRAMQYRSALAAVARQDFHAKFRILPGHGGEPLCAVVGTAVDDDPDRSPLRARGAHGVVHLGSRVVAWNENQVRRRGNDQRHVSGCNSLRK